MGPVRTPSEAPTNLPIEISADPPDLLIITLFGTFLALCLLLLLALYYSQQSTNEMEMSKQPEPRKVMSKDDEFVEMEDLSNQSSQIQNKRRRSLKVSLSDIDGNTKQHLKSYMERLWRDNGTGCTGSQFNILTPSVYEFPQGFPGGSPNSMYSNGDSLYNSLDSPNSNESSFTDSGSDNSSYETKDDQGYIYWGKPLEETDATEANPDPATRRKLQDTHRRKISELPTANISKESLAGREKTQLQRTNSRKLSSSTGQPVLSDPMVKIFSRSEQVLFTEPNLTDSNNDQWLSPHRAKRKHRRVHSSVQHDSIDYDIAGFQADPVGTAPLFPSDDKVLWTTKSWDNEASGFKKRKSIESIPGHTYQVALALPHIVIPKRSGTPRSDVMSERVPTSSISSLQRRKRYTVNPYVGGSNKESKITTPHSGRMTPDSPGYDDLSGFRFEALPQRVMPSRVNSSSEDAGGLHEKAPRFFLPLGSLIYEQDNEQDNSPRARLATPISSNNSAYLATLSCLSSPSSANSTLPTFPGHKSRITTPTQDSRKPDFSTPEAQGGTELEVAIGSATVEDKTSTALGSRVAEVDAEKNLQLPKDDLQETKEDPQVPRAAVKLPAGLSIKIPARVKTCNAETTPSDQPWSHGEYAFSSITPPTRSSLRSSSSATSEQTPTSVVWNEYTE